MQSQAKYLFGGIVLGCLITLVGAWFVGVEVTVNSLNNIDGQGQGQYQMSLIPSSGSPVIALLNTRTGEVVRIEEDGTRSVMNPAVTGAGETRRAGVQSAN